MIDESDDVTTWRFQRMSALAVAGSAMLHATALAALLPQAPPRQERLTEQAIELTLERPTAPFEAPAVPAAEQAAQRLPSGASAFAPAALAPGLSEAASAPTPAPAEPHLALTLPSAEPPPPPAVRDFGTSAAPPGPLPTLETMVPAVDAPAMVSGRDIARTAPSALARSSVVQDRPQALPPQQVVRQAAPKRASQQNEADRTGGSSPGAASPVTRVVARLTIGRDGRLVDVVLARPSGSPALDRGVIDTIRKASPFAPLPAELAADSHTFIVPINYAQER